jgi:NAD(P)-dependent dehydrogenase (short-subunit alcohol dehydrogenase family)
MTARLKGKVAWITGGGSGMGEGVAKLFAAEGAKVAVVDIDERHGKRVVEEIRASGADAFFTPCDVSKELNVKQSIDETIKKFGALQIIVNCAGIVHVKRLEDYSEADWDLLMGINLKSIFFSVKHGIAHLRKNPRTYMVNIGSVGSFVGQPSTPAYIASKGGVMQLSRTIAIDYAADGLRCNCVCPGITDTPMLRFHMKSMPDPAAALAKRLTRVPMGVALTPEDIARNVLFLCTEDSAGVTGTTLTVDGGYLAVAEFDTGGRTRFMEPV